MKKLLVLALAVVLTLSLAVVASASTFDPYVGGEFQLNYSPDTYDTDAAADDGTNVGSLVNDANGARFKSYVTGRVEDKDTGTWAKIGVKFTSWNSSTLAGTNWDEVYEAGIKATDNLTIWYTNDENNDCDRGQVPLVQSWFKFGGDPIFDKGNNNSLGFKYGSDSIDAALIYGLNTVSATGDNKLTAAATFKFDGGSVYVAFEDAGDDTSQTAAGVVYKFGFGTLKVDYSTWEPASGDNTSVIQASIDLLDSKLNVTVLSDDKQYFATDGGLGFGVTYNITDKLYVGGRSITPSDDTDKNLINNQDVFYLGVKYGVFDTRIGSATVADGDSNFFVMTHVGLW